MKRKKSQIQSYRFTHFNERMRTFNKCNKYIPSRKIDSNTKSYLLLLVSLIPTMIKTTKTTGLTQKEQRKTKQLRYRFE